MAHNIDFSNGRANFAFTGSRDAIWHRLGTQMKDGMSLDDWRVAAGLDWTAELHPAYVCINGEMVAV